MASYTLNINGEQKQVDVDPNKPLLWVLRDNLNLVSSIILHLNDACLPILRHFLY